MRLFFLLFFILASILTDGAVSAADELPRCLWVASYAPGYPWQDGIAQGIHSGLAGKCDLHEFHMDTKNNPSPDFIRQQAAAAKKLVDEYQPAVVIVSDDHASQYFAMPYYRDSTLPIVFCGINWSAKKYGYPWRNATGMVETGPIRPLVDHARRVLHAIPKSIFVLDGDNTSARLIVEHYKKIFNGMGIGIVERYVTDFAGWQEGFLEGQQHDLLILRNNQSIAGWNDKDAVDFVNENGSTLTGSMNSWMSPFTMLVYGRAAEEQGEWAAKVALEILSGTSPGEIPVVMNRRWEKRINWKLLEAAGLSSSNH